MREIKDYIDKFNVITMKGGDGGDSIHKTMMYYLGLIWNAGYFETGFGGGPTGMYFGQHLFSFTGLSKEDYHRWRRHPDRSKWYGHPDRLSRDQATPLVIALGEYRRKGFCKKELWIFIFKHILRLGFMTNTRRNWQYPTLEEHNENNPWVTWNYSWKLPDFCGPEFFGLYVRGLNLWWLYPLLLLSDIENFVNTIIKCWFYGRNPKNSDDQNHILSLLQSQRHLPTPISWLSRIVYVRYRPMAKPPQNPEYQTISGPQSALRYYFAEENGGPPIDRVFKEIVEAM